MGMGRVMVAFLGRVSAARVQRDPIHKKYQKLCVELKALPKDCIVKLKEELEQKMQQASNQDLPATN